MAWLPAGISALLLVVGAEMTVSLPQASTTQAAWRHELICALLAVFAIYGSTWAQGRQWPQPAALYGSIALWLVAAVLVVPGAGLRAFPLLSVVLAIGGLVAVPLEWRASAGHTWVLRVLVALSVLELVAITPSVAFFVQSGVLR